MNRVTTFDKLKVKDLFSFASDKRRHYIKTGEILYRAAHKEGAVNSTIAQSGMPVVRVKERKGIYVQIIKDEWERIKKGGRQPSGWLHYELTDGTTGLAQPKDWREVK